MEFDGNLVLTSQALSFLLLKIMYHTECCIFSLHIYLDRSMKSYIALSFFHFLSLQKMPIVAKNFVSVLNCLQILTFLYLSYINGGKKRVL